MPELEKKPVEVTEDNAATIAQEEHFAERAEKEGKTVEELKKEVGYEPPEGETIESDKPDEELLSATEDDLKDPEKFTDQDRERRQALIETQEQAETETKAERDRVLAADEADLSDEEKGRKEEYVKEVAKEKEDSITAYATDGKISVDDARAELESIDKIGDKYGHDSKKLAKSNLYLQRDLTKAKSDLKEIKEAKPAMPDLTPEDVMTLVRDGKVGANGKIFTEESIVEAFKEKDPQLVEDMDDDKIFRLAARDMQGAIADSQKKQANSQQGEIKKQADEKREAFFKDWKEEDKPFADTVKEILDKTPDSQIVSSEFSIEDYLFWAKGKQYESAIANARKESFDQGFKKGGAGKIITGPVGSGKTFAVGKGASKTMTDTQKTEAWNMFPTAKSDEECYALYLDVKAHEAKTKEKKEGVKV